MRPNLHYDELKSSYLFYHIEQRVNAYMAEHPTAHLLRLGVGDVTLPLCDAVITAMHKAVDDQAQKATFHGYMPECGAPFLKEAIRGHYATRGVALDTDEIFVSSGAGDDLGAILDLFSGVNTALVTEPAYPACVDSNIIAGHRVVHLPSSRKNGFLPMPDGSIFADIVYICSPNNPTGAVYNKEKLKAWVDYANAHDAILIFDAAYEAFIEDADVPHSIYEIEGSRTCAIEISSLSKTAGFTGVRCGYTVVPKTLLRAGMSLHDMWVRNRTTKTNGVSYIVQRGAAAVFTPEGQKQAMANIAVYKRNAAVLMAALDACDIWYCGGKNAPYLWMACPRGMGSWELFDYLLNEAQIVGTPGAGFGDCGEGYFRLSSFGDTADTKEAAKRIGKLFG